MAGQTPEKQSPEAQKPLPTTLDPEKMIEDMARQKLDFSQKVESKEAKAEIDAKKTELMAEAAKARAEVLASQLDKPEAAKAVTPEAPKPVDTSAPTPPAETPAAAPADAGAAPAEEKGMFAGIWDKIKTFFEDISKKFSGWFGGLFGGKSEEKIADSGTATNPPASPDKPIEGPDSTAGLTGDALLNNPQFKQRSEQIAKKIGVSLSDLYAIFKMEGHTPGKGVDAQAINPTSGASGLIQWMPQYAPKGTTIDQIRKMTGLQQLEYVDKHFSAQAGKIKSFADMYALVFWPAAVGKPADYVFGAPDMEYAKKVAKQNSGIAKHSQRPDGLIDKAAFDRYANSQRPKDSALVS